MNRRIAVVGPTATGKTEFAIYLARQCGGELINADSRQVIRDAAVGTAKPSRQQMDDLLCHCFDLFSVGEAFSTFDWLEKARKADDDIKKRGKVSIIVGGTGLYVTSLIDGFSKAMSAPPGEDRELRNQMVDEGKLPQLVAEFKLRDPEGASTLDLNNPRRVIRALEILDSGFERIAEAQRRDDPRPAIFAGIDLPRDVHEAEVRQRAQAMYLDDALPREIAGLRQAGASDAAIARVGIGYPETLEFLKGRLTKQAAIELTVRRTLKYAKAQRTWWRRDQRVRWIVEGQTKQTFAQTLLT